MSDFQSLPDNPDILSIEQEKVVMLIASLASGIDRNLLHPDYFDFSYLDVDGVRVNATFTGRPYSKTGERGKWTGSKTIELVRARLNQGTTPIQLVVNYRPGMSMEHVLRALNETYSFNVSASELLIKDADGPLYKPFNLSLRPPVGTIHLKFGLNQVRIIPQGSEFSIRLDNSARPDISDYLTVIRAGSVLGGL